MSREKETFLYEQEHKYSLFKCHFNRQLFPFSDCANDTIDIWISCWKYSFPMNFHVSVSVVFRSVIFPRRARIVSLPGLLSEHLFPYDTTICVGPEKSRPFTMMLHAVIGQANFTQRQEGQKGCYFRALDFEGERNTLGWVRLG